MITKTVGIVLPFLNSVWCSQKFMVSFMVNLIALKDKILIKYISCNEIPATFIKCTMFLFKYKYSETLFAFPRVKFVLPKITPLLKSSQLPKTSLECYIKRRNSHDQESYKSWGMVTKHYTSFEK